MANRILILVAVACAVWLGNQLYVYGRSVERQSCHLQGTTEQLQDSERERKLEAATTTARTGAADDHIDRLAALQADRDAAAAAADGLRVQLAAAQRRATQGRTSGDPASEQGRAAVDAIATVFAACEAEQRSLAEAAEQHRITGLRCEAEYDALTAEAPAASDAGTPAEGAGQ